MLALVRKNDHDLKKNEIYTTSVLPTVTSRGEDVTIYIRWYEPAEFAHSFYSIFGVLKTLTN